MKKITVLLSLIILIGCETTKSNIQIDSVTTFNLDNYNDFNIKINNSNISPEINPIVLEQFKENLKNAIENRGIKFNKQSNLVFDINFTTKDKVESNRINHYYSRYYWDYYSFKDDLYTVTENILRINLRNSEEDKTLWTVVTVWRDGSSRSISYDEASNILVEEIMASFL
jgi:hypothetical protein|tara:strand:+ start:4084 stop:4596 length:513 start_codon:yes stop_codon:yes gene_type:complete